MASHGKTKVTMLSGFLGAGELEPTTRLHRARITITQSSNVAGKTTLLRYVLENSKEKIACIVNDVASVNIDAKLVRNDRNRKEGAQPASSSTMDLADTIELQNGCACEWMDGIDRLRIERSIFFAPRRLHAAR